MATTKQAPAKKTGNEKTKVQPPEVSPVTLIKELPLEKVIENKLAENNVTKRVLNAMKDKYLVKIEGEPMVPKLKEVFILKNPTDKETYLAIKAERRDVRKVGIITEDICKKGREDAIRIQKLWLDKQKEVLGEVATVQDLLDEQIKIFDDEEERLRLEEEKRKDEQLNVRQNELIQMGAVNANGCMNINDLSIENSNIREADDDTYKTEILPLFKMHYENNEKDRIAREEQQKKDDELRKQQQRELEKQKQELENQKRELENQKRQFDQQQQEMKEQKVKSRKLQLEVIGMAFSLRDDAYAFGDLKVTSAEIADLDEVAWETRLQNLKPAIDQRKAAAKEKEDRKQQRSAQLSSLGMTFTGNAYNFESINISGAEIVSMEGPAWDQLISTTTIAIADLKQKAEEKKKKDWEEEQARIAEENKKRQEEEAAKASDKDKWQNFVSLLEGLAFPEFKSSQYKSKVVAARQKLKEISQL